VQGGSGRMADAIVATAGRFAGLQEILPNEAADETGGLGEVEPRGNDPSELGTATVQ
jgi:VIT1/CCC1 family predicted Fe2+/Mn2+ transporter